MPACAGMTSIEECLGNSVFCKESGMPDSSVAVKPIYEVVSPVGESVDDKTAPGEKSQKVNPAAPLDDLNGKKIGLVWSAFKNGNVFLEAMEDLLGKQFKGAE